MTATQRSIRLLIGSSLLLMLVGCGDAAKPADPGRAEAILRTALDAWKAGEAPEALAARQLPILMSDHEWKGGYRLISYRPEAEGRLVGFDMAYPVVLELRGPKGKKLKKTAVYVVTTDPQSLIHREEG